MPDLDTLIQRYLEDRLSEEEARELLRHLEAEPALGHQLLDHLHMDEMLRSTRPMPAVKAPVLEAAPRQFGLATVAAAAALAACATVLATWAWVSPTSKQAEEMTTASVAVLTRGVNLRWQGQDLTPGTPLVPGLLKLESGIAQIEFYQGARLTLEGPAELELVSSGEASCSKGKLSAHVPPQAKGFRINTPKGSIVDLGTEFGLEIGDAAAAVHVFEGEVELHQKGAPMKPLVEGQAVDFGKEPMLVAANAADFASLAELDTRSADLHRSRHERWLAASQTLNTSPGLRLRFDFQDGTESRTLKNHAKSGADIADGSIVGSSWTDGRWPGKRALEFRNVSDRVRLSGPGELRSLTMAAWVRVAGLDRAFNSLFMSEGWGNRAVHWQITRAGNVRLGVAGAGGNGHADYDAPPFFTPERFGRWTHLAVTFDPLKREVRHYADGQRVSTEAMRDADPLRISMAELGNWNDGRGAHPVAIRHLSGAMDEFALWDRALSDDEILQLARFDSHP